MNFIVAVDEKWNIGRDGNLLQRIPDDMEQFKEKTLNNVVVMGRRTLESFPDGKPLKGRINIILTRQEGFTCKDALVCHSYGELATELEKHSDREIFVIGGGFIYRDLIPFCDTGYITKIHKTFDADTRIPNLDKAGNWYIASENGPHYYKDDIYYSYLLYKNNSPKILI